MQSTIHSCLSGSGDGDEMLMDFLVEMMSEYRLNVNDIDDIDVGMETGAL